MNDLTAMEIPVDIADVGAVVDAGRVKSNGPLRNRLVRLVVELERRPVLAITILMIFAAAPHRT